MDKILSLLISVVALILSIISLWRSHFAKFKPLIITGDLFFQIFPIMNSKNKWFIPSAIVTISIANEGARPGAIYGLRITATYPKKHAIDHNDVLEAVFELDVSKDEVIGKNRFPWLNEHSSVSWTPVIVPAGGTITKRLAFETRWNNPIAPEEMKLSLEILTNKKKKWQKADEWHIPLKIKDWSFFTCRNGGARFPSKGEMAIRNGNIRGQLPKELIHEGVIPPSWTDDVEPSTIDYDNLERTKLEEVRKET
jgi:hypothetical protein